MVSTSDGPVERRKYRDVRITHANTPITKAAARPPITPATIDAVVVEWDSPLGKLAGEEVEGTVPLSVVAVDALDRMVVKVGSAVGTPNRGDVNVSVIGIDTLRFSIATWEVYIDIGVGEI